MEEDRMLHREKGRQNALKKELPPRLGPKGYRGWEEEWKDEIKYKGLLTDAHKIYDPRSHKWSMARLKKDESGVKFVPIELSPKVDELLQLDCQMREGSWKPESGSDLLCTVIGPEHPGCLRTIVPIGKRKGLENYKETRKRTSIKEMQSKMVDMQNQIQVLMNHVGVGKPEMEVTGSPEMRKSSCGSTMMTDPFDELEEPQECMLLVPNIDRNVVCARGMVYPSGSGSIHGVSIRKGHTKVHVDHVEKQYLTLDLPVSIPDAEIYQLNEARKSFIQWPKKAIVVSKERVEIPSPTTSRPTPSTAPTTSTSPLIPSTATSPSRSTSPSGSGFQKTRPSKLASSRKLSGSMSTHESVKISRLQKMQNLAGIISTRPTYVQAFYASWMKRKDPTLGATFDIDGTIFGEKHVFHVPLEAEEVMRFLTEKDLHVSIIALFAKMLHDEIIRHPKGNRCVFLNPYLVDESSCVENPWGVEIYLEDAMQRGNHDTDTFLLPYHQGSHWSLLILLKSEDRGFILDSSNQLKTWKNYPIIEIINRRFGDFEWKMAKVQQQSSNWECGFYVMRWMYDFVLLQQHLFPGTIPWVQSRPFTQKMLDAIVGMWIKCFGIPV